jgi:hypothetical protein
LPVKKKLLPLQSAIEKTTTRKKGKAGKVH